MNYIMRTLKDIGIDKNMIKTITVFIMKNLTDFGVKANTTTTIKRSIMITLMVIG